MYVNKMNELEPNFERFKDTKIIGKRLFNEVTFNPSSANPGETIYVNIPNLGENMCQVPNSLFLTAKFKSKNTKSWFLNNLGRLLVQELQINVGENKRVYENTRESLFAVYSDLWLPEDQRTNMADVGIVNENTRKLMSKDDTADKTVVADKTLVDVFAELKLNSVKF